MRPRLSHTPARIFSISSSDFCGKAARRFSRPTRCSGRNGPIRRMRALAKSALRLRSRRLIAPRKPATTALTIESRNMCARPRSAISAPAASEQDDDLAEDLPAFEAGKTAIELGERDFRIDHRQKPRGHLVEAVADIAHRSAERSEDAILLQIELEKIDGRRLSGRRAAGDEPAAALEAQERAVERIGTDMLENDVDALLARELAHHAFETVRSVIDDVIGTERFCFRRFRVVAHGGDDRAADRLRHLDRDSADAGAASLHQNCLAGLELGVIEQHVLYG